MKCQKCQTEIPDEFKFCPECGSNISGMSGSSSLEKIADLSLGAMRTIAGETGTDGGDRSLGDLRTMQTGTGLSSGMPGYDGIPLTDRYVLGEELGRGGFAVVWKAQDKKLERTVAVKRLLPGKDGNGAGAQTLERFAREATSIAQLNHRNILLVFDHDADTEGHYIVMEYVAGGTLRDYLKSRGGKLPVAEALEIVKGIAQGLGYAHRKNLVHRDIKPANILLDTSDVAGSSSSVSPRENVPNPKIVDFGLARMGSDSELSMSGFGMGTPWYMPPEQRRNAKGVNHTADIYAVGKVLYELVSGDVPDNVDPDMVPEPWLVPVILKCIKTNPAERYFSCEDLVRDLKYPITPQAEAGNGAPSTGNVCLSCGNSNPDEVKFCEGCGSGLTRNCPECGRENAVRKQYCGACGTDVDAFLQIQSALPVIQRYHDEKHWSRVQKECGLLPSDPRLPGEKGRNLVESIKELRKTAGSSLEEAARLMLHIRALIDREDCKQALEVIKKCRDLDPHRSDLDDWENQLDQKYSVWQQEVALKELQDYQTKGDYRVGITKCNEYIQLYPDGLYKSVVGKIQEEFEKFEKLRQQFELSIASADFERAAAINCEMELEDANPLIVHENKIILKDNRAAYTAFEQKYGSFKKGNDIDVSFSELSVAVEKWPLCPTVREKDRENKKQRGEVALLIKKAKDAIDQNDYVHAKENVDLALYIWPGCSKASKLLQLIEEQVRKRHKKDFMLVMLIFIIIIGLLTAAAVSS